MLPCLPHHNASHVIDVAKQQQQQMGNITGLRTFVPLNASDAVSCSERYGSRDFNFWAL